MRIGSFAKRFRGSTNTRLMTKETHNCRWLADVAVIEAFEPGLLDLPDFYFTGDDYRHRFEVEAKLRFLDLLHDRFKKEI
jgi:hypothetical protein